MVRPWRPKRSRRNARRAPGRTGPGCVMRGPLLVLGWPELSELEGCVGCRALAEHGLRSCRWTRLGGYARAGLYARPDVSPHGPASGAVSCWTELVGYVRVSEGRRAVGSVGLNGIRTGRAVRGQARGGCALRAVMRFALDREPTASRCFRGTPGKIIIHWSYLYTTKVWAAELAAAAAELAAV